MNIGRHLLGILFTAMVLVSVPTLAIFGWQVSAMLIRDGRYGGGAMLLLFIAVHALGICYFGSRLLTRGPDRIVSVALFISLFVPTLLGVGAGWEYLTRVPPPPHIVV